MRDERRSWMRKLWANPQLIIFISMIMTGIAVFSIWTHIDWIALFGMSSIPAGWYLMRKGLQSMPSSSSRFRLFGPTTSVIKWWLIWNVLKVVGKFILAAAIAPFAGIYIIGAVIIQGVQWCRQWYKKYKSSKVTGGNGTPDDNHNPDGDRSSPDNVIPFPK